MDASQIQPQTDYTLDGPDSSEIRWPSPSPIEAPKICHGKQLSIPDQELELVQARPLLEREVQEALPRLELVRTGTTANPRRHRAKRRSHSYLVRLGPTAISSTNHESSIDLMCLFDRAEP